MAKILVAEDDRNTARLMKAVLEHAGYEVLLAGDGEQTLEVMEKHPVDLILLDVMMPKMNGYEVTEYLRLMNNTIPILMVTARQMPADKIQGFRSGTDDYLTKPVNEEEMLLRIQALLRRARISTEHKLTIGPVVLDADAYSISRTDKPDSLINLPQKEFQLLFKLLSNPNKIFTRLQLMDEIWGSGCESGDTTVTVHVNRLRKKLGDWPEFDIVAIRGVGYKAVIHEE